MFIKSSTAWYSEMRERINWQQVAGHEHQCTDDWHSSQLAAAAAVASIDARLHASADSYLTATDSRRRLQQSHRHTHILHADTATNYQYIYVISAAQLRSHVLTAIGLVNGNPAFLTHHRIDVPYLIAKKFVTGDYVHDFYSCAKFSGNPSMRDFWANRWNITQNVFY